MGSRGQVQIEVVADTAKFPAQVERELKAALKGLQVQPVKVQADTSGFSSSIKKSQDDAKKSFSDLWGDLTERASKAGAGIGKAFGAALAPALVASVAPAVSGVVSLLASIGPAALTALPAAVGVLSTVKVALFGVGDALKEVGSDQDKYNEATAGLSVNAKKFTNTLRALLPDLKDLKNQVQNSFFAGFNKDLKATAKTLIGPTTIGMTSVATRLNGIVHTVAEYAASSKGADAVTGVFRTTAQVLDQVSGALGPVIDKLLDYIIAGTNAKSVDAAFTKAKTTISGLAVVAGNLKSALGSVFGGFTPQATSTVDVLIKGSAALKDFLASANAQGALAALGTILKDSQGTLSQVLQTLPQLLPVLANLASGGFDVLSTAVSAMVSAAKPFVDFLANNPQAARDLGVAIGTIVVAVKAYQAALVLSTAAQIAWKAITVTSTAVAYGFAVAFRAVQLAVALGQIAFYQAGAAITVATAALWENVTAGAANALQWGKQAIAAVASGIQQVASLTATGAAWLILVARSWLAVAATTAYAVAQRAAAIASNVWAAAQWLLNAAMDANPIGVIILVIVALVAAIVIAYQKSDTFRAIVQGAFAGIAAAATWLYENALKPLFAYWSFMFGVLTSVASAWWSAVQAYFGFVAAAATTLWSWIVAAWNGIVAAFNFVVSGAASFVSSVIGFFVNLKNQAAANISGLISFVTSIPGRLLSAIGNLGSLLYNAGRSIIQGLINGVASMISSLTSKLSFVTNLIPDWKGPLDKDRKLLVPAGQAIMQGLQSGIGDEQNNLRQQLSGVTNTIASTPMGPGLQGQVRGGDGATADTGGGLRVWPGQDKSAGTIVIQSDGTRYSELLVQELSHAVRVRGGDVQKVVGTSSGGVE